MIRLLRQEIALPNQPLGLVREPAHVRAVIPEPGAPARKGFAL
jgi:hypothetical protein